MKYRANYGYAVKGKLRSGALIIEAKDIREAKVEANKQLAAEYDWHQLNSIIQLTSTNTQP